MGWVFTAPIFTAPRRLVGGLTVCHARTIAKARPRVGSPFKLIRKTRMLRDQVGITVISATLTCNVT